MEQNLIAAFAQENMKTIYAYALSRVSDKEDAEDLAGDILLALLSSASRLRDEDALYGFVWSVAGNTYKKFLRKKNRQALNSLSQEDLEQLADPEDFTLELELEENRQEQLARLRRELSLLSREYRECTLYYYFMGLSCRETAKKMGISLDMTKYYLFKTRKLLKEGIGMEREYGTKSYQPAKFTFKTIFSESYNREYVNLFNRLLPGNILLSAYYHPVTIRELALETGVPTAYLEDEVALLVKYGLLNLLSAKAESGAEKSDGREQIISVRDAVYAGSEEYVLFNGTQLSEVENLLKHQIRAMADLHEQMISAAQELLRSHSPESVWELIPNVIGMSLFYDTVGLLGKCALDSGSLSLPDTEYPLAVFLYSTDTKGSHS